MNLVEQIRALYQQAVPPLAVSWGIGRAHRPPAFRFGRNGGETAEKRWRRCRNADVGLAQRFSTHRSPRHLNARRRYLTNDDMYADPEGSMLRMNDQVMTPACYAAVT